MECKKKTGKLIVFEGIDGTGKSTQVQMLARALEKQGHEVVLTREPTEGQFGQEIRKLYVNRGSVSRQEELQLFIDDRREHVEKLIDPALIDNKIVITDRYYFSTAAYQGAAGMDPENILKTNEAFAPEPDLVLFLDIPVSESVRRIQDLRHDTLNAFEQEESLQKVSAIFKSIKRKYIKKIDAGKSIEEVHLSVLKHVKSLFN